MEKLWNRFFYSIETKAIILDRALVSADTANPRIKFIKFFFEATQ